jgi:hypothetical protein
MRVGRARGGLKMSEATVLNCRAFVTVSVDDGHPTDLRTADLLHKYGLKATFYAPAANPERAVMSPSDLQQLSRNFEVGGHTLNHVSLPSLPRDVAWSEIVDCKSWLEDLTGKTVVSFCYPKGKFDRVTAGLAKKAGFLAARTCLFNLHDFPEDPFRWGVSTHAYSHSHLVQMRHALLEGNFNGAWNYWNVYKGTTDWQQQFLRALDHVGEYGGIAHLGMHSWEIDAFGHWDLLESVFKSIADRPSLASVTNGTLFEMASAPKIIPAESGSVFTAAD